MKLFNGISLLSAIFVLCLGPVSAGATQQSAVALGAASTFAALAGTTVTVTGGGVINGNIGINPGTAFVAGVPAVTVNGTVYPAGPVAAQAQADLALAFNDAAGRQTPVLVAGNLGGLTLTPGLYKSTSSLAISSGDLTLDAQGDSTAVFIFQIASTLTLTSGRQVILTGGANPANIFWQVGSSATLGTTSVLYGNVLAAVSITTLTGARLVGRALAQSGAVSIDTGGGSGISLPSAPPPPVAPTVTSTVPANGGSGVAIGNKLSATFSTAMNAATINGASFTLAQGLNPVAGTVTYLGNTATFTPAVPLASLTGYTARITTAASDTNGVALAAPYAWSFTTGAMADTTPPVVVSTVPATGATSVAINGKLSVTFSEPMDPASIASSTFAVLQGIVPVAGTVSYTGSVATFSPAAALSSSTAYTATISTAAKDLAGNALASPYSWSFTTGAALDITPPAVTATNPVNGAFSISAGVPISVTFTEALDPLSVTTGTLTVSQGVNPVGGTVSFSGLTATFTPSGALLPSAVYTVNVSAAVKDLAGNALTAAYTFSFTIAALVVPPPPVPVVRPVIFTSGVVNEASYVSPVAAGSIAAVFGSNLSGGQFTAPPTSPLPSFLGQTSFNIGGTVPPVFFVSPGQVNVQIPWELAGQTQVTIGVTANGVASDPGNVALAPFSPGIFTLDMSGKGQGAILVVPSAQLANAGSPASAGGYIAIFCTGLGAVTNRPATGYPALSFPLSTTLAAPTVTIGGVSAPVTYSGLAPTLTGVYQINAKVPAGVNAGGAVPVIVTIGGAVSNTATIAVR